MVETSPTLRAMQRKALSDVSVTWHDSLAEVPVEVEHSERSTVRVVRDGARLVADLIRIRQRSRRGGYPDRSTSGPPT